MRAVIAVLFGAVGGPRWDDPAAAVRPEQGLLALRKMLGLYAFPDVRLTHLLVDACAMHLLRAPADFDVIVTGGVQQGLYEPIHGSAPDIAGRGMANPLGAIGSVAMLLRHSFGLVDEARAIDDVLSDTLTAGWRTADIHAAGGRLCSTSEMGTLVAERITAASR